MFKARIKADSLKEFIGTVGSLVDEAKINVSEDGLQVKAVDPSHVAMIEANLMKSAFDSFEVSDIQMGLDIDKFTFKNKHFNLSMVLVVYYWCKGQKFSDICKLTDIMEGTIVRIMLRLIETLLEIKKIGEIIGNISLQEKMEECVNLVKRDIVYTESLYI